MINAPAAGLFLALLISTSASVASDALPSRFQDPLQVPALSSEQAGSSPLMGVARAGDRMVSVGQRGHIVISEDQGQSWRQVAAPVSTDLTAVYFVDDSHGWIVGHDGVVLHSSDGGLNWALQLDGVKAAKFMVDYYAQDSLPQDDPDIQAARREAEMVAEQAPSLSFLDVWFRNEKEGFVIGAFNLVLKTNDGGVTWEPWYHRMDNPDFFHLYAISGSGDQVFIAGERGLLLRLDTDAQRFVAMPRPYHGSFFGVAVSEQLVVAYGLRGNAYISRDAGQTWEKANIDIQAALTSGAIDDRGRILLASQRGHVLESKDGGSSFAPITLAQVRPIYDLTLVGEAGLALVGASGLRVETLKQSN
ncbi:MAG: YCF48-related protein [Rhodocyclaceae bacterium]|jgi:photosystem II stability/assembly factor-like uncharacterized protein|nr:YCF48-related protein [Rhodocyclaceae bacterium]